jgi:cystathionine gamma-synthase
MTRLEGGASSLLVSSGMAAATTAFLALERPAHVIAPRIMYWALRKWLQEDAASHAIEVTLVDASEPAAIAAAGPD